MQNSSFLFNYDSEDSSAHSSNSYQFNSSFQTETGGSADGAGEIKSSAQSTHQLGFSDHSISTPPPENERDGDVEYRTDVKTQTAAPNVQPIDQAPTTEQAEILPDGLDEIALDQSSTAAAAEDSDRINPHLIWQNALSELALQVPSATYDTWLRDTSVIAYEDGEFIIGLPNAYAQDWLTNRFMPKIKRVLVRLVGRSVHVTFRVVPAAVVDSPTAAATPLYDTQFNEASSHAKIQDTSQHNNPPIAESASTGEGFIDERSAPVSDENDMTQSMVPQNRLDSIESRPVAFDNLNSAAMPNSSVDGNAGSNIHSSSGVNYSQNGHQQSNHSNHYQSQLQNQRESGLQSGYTFDSFIVGSHNQLAHAAAASISERPGNSFNPLFIYGGVGLGKTHLLHAVGNAAIAQGNTVLYCTSEQFTNELISSIRGRGTDAFRSKYRQVDVLLIDDIQFIAGKESTQEEFFHTFNHLHNLGRQVVLSSDRPPRALATLEERLRSRFEGGLLTDISPPDFETRVAILQSKANKSGIKIHTDVLMLVAERVDSNIRELEGALNRMVVQAKLFSGTLDLQLAESILRNLAPQRSPRSPHIVVQIVAEHFHLTEADLLGRSRTKEIAHARQTAMYLLREENAMSLPSIGDLLGGRDHSTVRHGVEKITKDLDGDEQLRREIMTLRDKIYSAPELGA